MTHKHMIFLALVAGSGSLQAMGGLAKTKTPAIKTVVAPAAQEVKRKAAEENVAADAEAADFTIQITVNEKGVRQCRALYGNTGETMLFVYIMNMSTSDEPKVRADYLEKIKAVIKASKDLNQPDKRGDTSLVYAINAGVTDVALEFIKAGADIDKAGNKGMTPLMAAAVQQNEVVIQALISRDVDIYKTDDSGDDALKYVCKAIGRNKDIARNWSIVRILFKNMPHGGWWENKAAKSRYDILMENERYRFFDEFSRILRYEKVDKIAKAHSILDCVEELEMVEFFLMAMDINHHADSALLVAVKEGTLDLVDRIIMMGAALNQPNIDGNFPLWCALYEKRKWPIAKRLIEAGANVHQQLHGNAPLDLLIKGHALVDHSKDRSLEKLELVDLLEAAAKKQQAEQKKEAEGAAGAAPADKVEGLGLA